MNRQELVKRRSIKAMLYAFRRAYGVPADLYKVTITSPDMETGDTGETRIKVYIPQMITGSVDLIRKFEYDLGYVKANSNFTYGATFEIGDRIAIVDAIYLSGYRIQQKDYLVYDSTRYDIQRIVAIDGHVGYFLHLRQTKGSKPRQIIEKKVISQLDFTQETTYGF